MSALIGKGYGRGWWTNFHGRYRLYKGARNTKKSYVMIGYEVIDKVLTDPRRNVLILRKSNESNRYSTFSTLCKIINEPAPGDPSVSLASLFRINQTTMTITRKSTGQVIIFDGLASPTKITGSRTAVGYLTDVYVDEAFELESYDEWRMVDGTIRGKLPEGLFFQITFCFNAWSGEHWINQRFFRGRLEDDAERLMSSDYVDYLDPDWVGDYGKGLYLHIGTYRINEFRDPSYDASMEAMRLMSPAQYQVEALGMWGNASEATYPDWGDHLRVQHDVLLRIPLDCYSIGLDTGLSDGTGKPNGMGRLKSATTMQLVGLSSGCDKLISFDEYFFSNERQLAKKTEPQLYVELVETLWKWIDAYRMHPVLMKGRITVYVDSGDKGFREGLALEARRQGLANVEFAPSTKRSIQERVDFMDQMMAWGDYQCSWHCPNLMREFSASRRGSKGEPRENFDDHAINAFEYAWAPIRTRILRYKTFKPR